MTTKFAQSAGDATQSDTDVEVSDAAADVISEVNRKPGISVIEESQGNSEAGNLCDGRISSENRKPGISVTRNHEDSLPSKARQKDSPRHDMSGFWDQHARV